MNHPDAMTTNQHLLLGQRLAEFLTPEEASMIFREPFIDALCRAVERGHEFAIKKQDDGSIGLCVRPASGVCSWTFAKP